MHMDPEHPVPGTGDGMLLQTLPPEAIDEIIRTSGATSSSPLVSVELRQLGGELGRARPENGASAAVEAEYALYAVGIAPTPEAAAAVAAHVEIVKEAMNPWAAEQMYLNFAETRRDPRTLWTEQAYHRLRRIKDAVDPTNLIRSNHSLV
jgi:FAD/FMN-containing dehydrogenase